MVYSGIVPIIPSHARGILPTLHPPLLPLTVTLKVGGATDQVGVAKDSEKITRKPPLVNPGMCACIDHYDVISL